MASNIVSDLATRTAAGDIAEDAFNLWAVLKSASARLLQMRDAGEVADEQFAEVWRMLRVGTGMANDIGERAMDMPN